MERIEEHLKTKGVTTYNKSRTFSIPIEEHLKTKGVTTSSTGKERNCELEKHLKTIIPNFNLN